MEVEKYINDRLDGQINWYSDKSSINKNYYYFFKTTEIVFAAIVPFLIASSEGLYIVKFIAGVLSIAIGIISGVLIAFKFQEKWIQYRATSESLKHEKYLYETKSGMYLKNPDFSVFVERVEFIISKENSDWTQIVISKEVKPETPNLNS
ncbi:MAG: DUF4231 domain-containing protein [Bacteroidales bacterium]|nr:DUF4231 domain-containing protein [Bacteroidales bacterium]